MSTVPAPTPGETAWVRTGNPHWLRLTKFFGKLFLINFAIGVVTGTVLTSLLAFTLVYAVLAVVEIGLILKYVRAGADPVPEDTGPSDTPDRPLAFAY